MFSERTQQTVAPYRLWVAIGGHRYLMHGQKTEGANNSVPVRSVKEAQEIAAAWRADGVKAPYRYPDYA